MNDADLRDQLKAQDPDPSHWAKATTDVFDDTHPFQVHFYRHLPTDTIRFDLDFKIRTRQSSNLEGPLRWLSGALQRRGETEAWLPDRREGVRGFGDNSVRR
jgi:hypothetical protein